MRTLIVEDEFVGRMYLQKLLGSYGHCDIAVDGKEALEAYVFAIKSQEPYDLICMDIMMPKIDGRESVRRIREMEKKLGISDTEEVKIIMTTTRCDAENVMGSIKDGATSYIIKPIDPNKMKEELVRLSLIDKIN